MAVNSIRGGGFKYNLKSLFLNVSVQAAVQLEAQNIQVLSFNSSCFLSPQIVIDAFILNSFPLLINPPLLFYSNTFVSVHLKLFSISAVRNFIVRYFSCWLLFAGQRPHIVWITHSQASNAPP